MENDKYAFKIAIAAAFSLILAQQSRLEYPIYAVLAAVMVMGVTYKNTYIFGRNRMISTFIGVIGGAFFVRVLGGTNFWTFFLCVFFCSVIANWKFPDTTKSAGFMSAVLILSHSLAPWSYAWNRFWETLLGTAVALLVNYLIFPAPAIKELRKNVSQTIDYLNEYYQIIIEAAFKGNYNNLRTKVLKKQLEVSFRNVNGLWKEVIPNQSTALTKEELLQDREFIIHRIFEHILTIENTVVTRENDKYWQITTQPLSQLAQETTLALVEISTTIKKNTDNTFTVFEMIDFSESLEACDLAFDSIRSLRRQEGKFSDDFLKFCTFFCTMKEIARKIDLLVKN